VTSLCVYCGSSFGVSDAYAAAATELGTLCARRGITIVYGGGGVGLMGLLADAASVSWACWPTRLSPREAG